VARKSVAQKHFENIVSSLHFEATPAQRDAKSAFWLAMDENPIVDLNAISVAGIVQLVDQPKIEEWWTKAGFSSWFMNREEFRMKLESATFTAISILQDIMLDPDANPSARVNAAKLVIEASGKNLSRNPVVEEVSDSKIQKMSEKELDAYVMRHAKALAKAEESK
jgi:hypothetical protein